MKTTKILRKDLDGSQIRRTPGSMGLQVFLRGKFVSLQFSLAEANGLLDQLQAGADRRCGLADDRRLG